jgi:hypothetical protein
MPTPNQRASRRQENDVAADNDGTPTPGSGNTWRAKNDVRASHYSYECKTTTKKSFSLKRSDLDVAEINALSEGRDMIYVVDIDGKRYYAMRDYTWRAVRSD